MPIKQQSQMGWILSIALASLGVCITPAAQSAETEVVPAIDATHGVALEGYDAVAYFLDHRPIRIGIDIVRHGARQKAARWHDGTDMQRFFNP